MAVGSAKVYRLNAIIVDPDIGTRMRLKQATSSVGDFGDTTLANNPTDAITRLEGDHREDVVFISYRYQVEEITKFIQEAKKTKQGQLCAYVMVMQSKNQDSSTIAGNMMIGADGFLFEPYSVESLVEMTQLATRVRKEREAAREKMVVTLLMNDIINQIDLVSYVKSCGFSVARSMEKLRELCLQLQQMPEEYLAMRMEIVVNQLIEARLPAKSLRIKQYSGVSSRVKARMEKKMMSKMELQSQPGAAKVPNPEEKK